MQEHIEHIVLKHSDVDWKNLLVDLVDKEGMDPWDIDISLLTKKFIQTVKKMQEADLKISGKMFLATAMLYKIKSHHLLEHDITRLDELLNQSDEDEFDDDFYDTDRENRRRNQDPYTLIRRNPQPRKRKVSIHDLVNALQKAMATRKRKLKYEKPNYEFKIPKGGFDITSSIQDLFNKITYYTAKTDDEKLSFTSLLPPRAGKQEKVHTFIPLLHLETEKKIDTEQKKAFDEVYVRLYSEKRAKARIKAEAKLLKEQEEREKEEAKKRRYKRGKKAIPTNAKTNSKKRASKKAAAA